MVARRRAADFTRLEAGRTIHGTAFVNRVMQHDSGRGSRMLIELDNSFGTIHAVLDPCDPRQATLKEGDEISGRFTAHRRITGMPDLIYATGVALLDPADGEAGAGADETPSTIPEAFAPERTTPLAFVHAMALLAFSADAFCEGDLVDSRTARETVLTSIDRLPPRDATLLRQVARDMGVLR